MSGPAACHTLVVAYAPYPRPVRPAGPRTGVLLAIVGALAALCCAGGTVAAFVVQRGVADLAPKAVSHRQPRDPCDLLGRDAFADGALGELQSARADRSTGCEYALRGDPHDPGGAGRTLRLTVSVSADARRRYADGLRGGQQRQLPVECGTEAYAAHRIDPAGQVADDWLWCVDGDVYLTLAFHGSKDAPWNGLELDEVLANLGRAAIANVPKA